MKGNLTLGFIIVKNSSNLSYYHYHYFAPTVDIKYLLTHLKMPVFVLLNMK